MRMLSRQSGFGLMEIIIAAGLMGIVAVGLASLISNMGKAQSQAQAKFSFTTLARDIQTQVQNLTACSNSLVVLKNLDPSSPATVSVKLGATTVKEGATLNNYSRLTVTQLQLRNIHLEGPAASGGNLFSADLFLGARTNAKFEMKPVSVSRLMLVANKSGKFLQCGDGGGDEAAMCKSLGGIYNAGATPPCQLGDDEAHMCNALGGSYDAKADPPCQLGDVSEDMCQSLGGTYKRGANPPCQLGDGEGSKSRICTAETHQTQGFLKPGRPGSGSANCCKANEKSSCSVIGTSTSRHCRDDNCTTTTTKYLCQCTEK